MRRLLEETIREELAIAAGIEGILLTGEVLDRFAWAVVTQVDYGFRSRWDAEWTQPGEPHTWAEDVQTRARCITCFAISPPSTSVDAAARWHADRSRTAHAR